ncbi:hypothetical protein EUX98_g7196 [Antrodiella citrinella]|uniref:Homoaconitase, mitochondrial n=1 Tax=Antrodiella citrinella TaxID=2447956 RepID=A0A4S4MPK9_9APHY|nr:hypothetical protein EUX98_g7196 [Antrodiella citrinella]
MMRFSSISRHRRCLATLAERPRISQTVIEKVVQKYAVGLPEGKVVKAGDYVMIRPQHVMTHDNTGPVISKFNSIGAKKIFNTAQPVFTLDHDVQNKTSKNLSKYASIEAFARNHGIDFYPAGRGIGHQVLVEEGYAFPHTLTVASDSHSNMYGGVGCVGTPIVRTDAAALWATGKTWWQVPRMVKVELKGRLAPGVTGKDIIVALCGSFNNDEVLNAAIEFTGDGIPALTVDDRLTIANMTTEWGALVGVFPVDQVTLDWYEIRLKRFELRTFASSVALAASIPPPPEHPRVNRQRLDTLRATTLSSDPGAQYSSHLILDLSTLVPYVSGPNSVKISNPLPVLESSHIPIHKAYLLSCTNSRVSDIAAAAAVIKGHKIAPGVELYVAAASSEVQQESERLGDWETLIAAGAKPLPAGCGPCIGLGTGLLEEGQVGISATNRNYKGRMGHPNAQAYLASPAVVAASAINGHISGPSSLDPSLLPPAGAPTFSVATPPAASAAPPQKEPSLPGFPSTFSGPIVFAPQDNLNTDGIYPGKYTYQDDITLERQAEVVMENYDPSFASLVASMCTQLSSTAASADVKQGVILVSGYNFGTGSSREQAATALKSAGVPVVIAGSFGDIFKRNAINNGLVCIECPELVSDFTSKYAKSGQRGAGGVDGELTVNKGHQVDIKVVDGALEVVFPGAAAALRLPTHPASQDPPAPVKEHLPVSNIDSRKVVVGFENGDWGRLKIIWGAKIEQSPPTVAYTDIMSDNDEGLFKWLSHVEKFGFCFVSGVPPTPEATEEMAKRIGFIRETQYGKFWEFTADQSKGDTAYTNIALGAHTDNTYFTDPCGLQMFHLLSHTEGTGGSTLLVDGFYVASLLKELHPTAYEILTRVGVPAHAAGETDSMYVPTPQGAYPVLREMNGELVQVRWNNDDRSVMNNLAPAELEEWYEAIRLWHKLITSADSEYWVQLSPGTAVVVDNHRILHGRSAFTGKRRMCGAYIGVDEYRSKLTVLRDKFAPDPVSSETVNGRSIWNPAL